MVSCGNIYVDELRHRSVMLPDGAYSYTTLNLVCHCCNELNREG